MTNQLSRIAIVACAMTLTAGCFGTEGGNPLDPHDAGPGRPDGDTGCDDAGAAPLEPVCEPDSTSPECTCALGERVAVDVQPEGYGQGARLIGPTSSGGFVVLHHRYCSEGCTETAQASLEVERFDASGARVGDAIEVTRSFGWADTGAVLRGSSLALAWAERSGTSGEMNVWFGELDVDTGAWTIAPHLAVEVNEPILGVGLARGTSGFGVVYDRVVHGYTPPSDESAFFARLDESGGLIGEPARIGPSNDGYGAPTEIVPHGDGYALPRWSGDTLAVLWLGADGSVGAPVSVAENRGEHGRGSMRMRANGTGYAVAWTDASGLRLARIDANGAIEGSIIDVGSGDIADMAIEDDGTIALVSRQGASCGWLIPDRVLLTRIDGAGERVHPDVVVHRTEGSDVFGGSVTVTPNGLQVAYVDAVPSADSTLWIVPACAP